MRTADEYLFSVNLARSVFFTCGRCSGCEYASFERFRQLSDAQRIKHTSPFKERFPPCQTGFSALRKSLSGGVTQAVWQCRKACSASRERLFRTVKGARRAIATVCHVTEEPFPRTTTDIPPVSRFCFADFCCQYFLPRGTYNYSFRTVFYKKPDCACDGIATVWQWWECIFHIVTSNGFTAMSPDW